MATAKSPWLRDLYGSPAPYIIRAKFKAGADQAIKRGEILELTGDTNTTWVPMDLDFDMDSNVAVANEDIKSGDLAGYYEIIVPRPGDVFQFALATAAATTFGTDLYWSTSQILAASGTYVIGNSVGLDNYPKKQGHTGETGAIDTGTTIRSAPTVEMVFEMANSYWSLIQTG